MASTDADPGVESCCVALSDCLGAAIDEEAAQALAARMKALADPVRLRLISLLVCCADGEICACDLPALLDRSQPTISHHLKQLTDAGFLHREQRGKWAWFSLVEGALDEVGSALAIGRTTV